MTSADLSADGKKYNKVVIFFCWPMKKELNQALFRPISRPTVDRVNAIAVLSADKNTKILSADCIF